MHCSWSSVFSKWYLRVLTKFTLSIKLAIPLNKDAGSLNLACVTNDFILDVDLERKLKYPEHIASSSRPPDIVLYSNQLELVIHLELTCPWKENFQDWHRDKGDGYGVGSEL